MSREALLLNGSTRKTDALIWPCPRLSNRSGRKVLRQRSSSLGRDCAGCDE